MILREKFFINRQWFFVFDFEKVNYSLITLRNENIIDSWYRNISIFKIKDIINYLYNIIEQYSDIDVDYESRFFFRKNKLIRFKKNNEIFFGIIKNVIKEWKDIQNIEVIDEKWDSFLFEKSIINNENLDNVWSTYDIDIDIMVFLLTISYQNNLNKFIDLQPFLNKKRITN